MAVSLMQVGKVGAVDTSRGIGSQDTPVTAYDETVTDKDVTIGANGTQLDGTTNLIGFCDIDNATGFRWAIVAAADAALPDNSPRWLPGYGRDWWEVRNTGAARFFKTAALS